MIVEQLLHYINLKWRSKKKIYFFFSCCPNFGCVERYSLNQKLLELLAQATFIKAQALSKSICEIRLLADH